MSSSAPLRAEPTPSSTSTRDDDPLGEGEGEEGEGEGEQGDCPAIAGATFGAAIALQVPRARHTATVLDDGRVLLVGGEDDSFLQIADVEIVDPVAGTSVAGPSLNDARYEHAAVKLADGSVVVAGGFGPGGHTASIERFNGTSWTRLDPLDAPRAGITGLALKDGRAVFFGGDNSEAIPTSIVVVDTTGAVSSPAGLSIGANRRLHSAVRLEDGAIFIAGGFFTSAIATTAFLTADATSASDGPPLPGARRQAMAVPLKDGSALIMGGIGTGATADVQKLAATRAGFTSVGALSAPRHSGRALALGCGVVVCGGLNDGAVARPRHRRSQRADDGVVTRADVLILVLCPRRQPRVDGRRLAARRTPGRRPCPDARPPRYLPHSGFDRLLLGLFDDRFVACSVWPQGPALRRASRSPKIRGASTNQLHCGEVLAGLCVLVSEEASPRVCARPCCATDDERTAFVAE